MPIKRRPLAASPVSHTVQNGDAGAQVPKWTCAIITAAELVVVVLGHVMLVSVRCQKCSEWTRLSATVPLLLLHHDIRVCRPSSSSLCQHDYAAGAADSSGNSWRPRLSGGSGAGVEQSASTDQGRLVAVVFSAADKGPSVSAVVQLTSDYCTIV